VVAAQRTFRPAGSQTTLIAWLAELYVRPAVTSWRLGHSVVLTGFGGTTEQMPNSVVCCRWTLQDVPATPPGYVPKI